MKRVSYNVILGLGLDTHSNTFIVALDVNGTGMLLTLIVTFPSHKMCNLADL